MRPTFWQYIVLLLILFIAGTFRFYGLDWDRGYLFHPDERQLLYVATRLELPTNAFDVFSTESPLNPKFFAYGSFPIYLIRILSPLAPASSALVPWRDTQLVNLAFFGRALSALFDLGTITLIFLLARRLYDETVWLIAAAFTAITVLHIQLSHFYAVDTLLTMLVVATMYFATRYAQIGRRREALFMSLAFGLALATKITALPLVVPIVVATVRARGKPLASYYAKAGIAIYARALFDQVWSARKAFAKNGLFVLAVFLITQPYALLDPIRFFGGVGTEAFAVRGWADFPYMRQYADTLPFVYQIVQSSIWGMGLPLGLFAWIGTAIFAWRWWRARQWEDGFILSWALIYFLIIGGQYAKYLRYLLPLLPFLYVMASAVLKSFIDEKFDSYSRGFWLTTGATAAVFVFTFAYAFSFTSIYSREHPWIQISRTIYQNVPANAKIATEQWDDALPVAFRFSNEQREPTEYKIQMLPMYDADDAAKLQMLTDAISANDYIVLASQRLYDSIPRLPSRYPISLRYYRALFDGQLGFELVLFARNDPRFDGITVMDDTIQYAGLQVSPLFAAKLTSAWNWGPADESFTVYDHPMPLVFKKTRALSATEVRALLSP